MSTVSELKIIFERNSKTNHSLANLLKKIEILDQHPIQHVYEISTTLDQIKNILPSLSVEDHTRTELTDWVNSRIQKLDNDKKEFTEQFGYQLATLLKTDGLELTGQYPDLKVKFYTVEIDFTKHQILIWYGPKQEMMSKVTKVEAEEAYKALKAIDKNLCGRDFDEMLFLKEVHSAYMNNIQINHRQEGDAVEIAAVLKELTFLRQDKKFDADPKKENFKEYGRAPFSYDLSRLSNRKFGTKTLTLDVATRMNTAYKSGFIWIPSGFRDGFACAYLAFKETL